MLQYRVMVVDIVNYSIDGQEKIVLAVASKTLK